MENKKWFRLYMIMQLVLIFMVIMFVAVADPYFHYHAPVPGLYYVLDSEDERSINDGIEKHFRYDAMITGTSMTQCFKTSQADQIFHRNFIKVPFAGGTYKEIDTHIQTALLHQKDLSLVIRGLDQQMILWDKDRMREDMGEYPVWLYNRCYLDDVSYIFNKDVVMKCMNMTVGYICGKKGGMTSFDEYANWMKYYSFGNKEMLSGRQEFTRPVKIKNLSEAERKMVKETIRQNVVRTVREYPAVDFRIFFPPYSIAAWGELYQQGELLKYLEAEKVAIEEMLGYENLKLYSFNLELDIILDSGNYRDPHHYGEWINTCILNDIAQDKGLLTKDNYQNYLEQEYDFFSSYDYNCLTE